MQSQVTMTIIKIQNNLTLSPQMPLDRHFIVRLTSLSLDTTDLFSTHIVLHFPECQIKLFIHSM